MKTGKNRFVRVLLAAALAVALVGPSAWAKEKSVKSVAEGGEGQSVTEWPAGVTKYVKGKALDGYTCCFAMDAKSVCGTAYASCRCDSNTAHVLAVR